ncbi:MAG: ABC transporter substrate-binding protein, partial [Leptolyngbya sp. DLM2.Bin15]
HDHGHDHDHDHGHDHGDDHGDDHAEASGDSHAGHVHHGEYNPHIWLDPKRAIQQVENIRDGLIAVDPDGETDYTANAAAYIEQLQALDAEFTERLAPFAGQTFVAFHDFAPYFAESYGLEAEFLVDVPEVNPSPEDVRRVIETVEASSLKTLLTEPQAGDDAFASLAGDLNVKVSVFDPMETGDATAMEPEAYFTIMRQNVDVLEASFSSSVQSWLYPWMPQPLATILQPTWATRPFATVVQPVGVR